MASLSNKDMSALKDLVDGELKKANYAPIGPYERKFYQDVLNYVCKNKHFSPGSISMIRDRKADWWVSGMAKVIIETLQVLGQGILPQPALERADELHEHLKHVVLVTTR